VLAHVNGKHVPSDVHLMIAEDGLTIPWADTGWKNPPSSGDVPLMDKLATPGDEIALIFARPGTAWSQVTLANATLVCFVDRCISCIKDATRNPAGSPGAGSAFIAYGDSAASAARQADLGVWMALTN
jgi:hypothetical protein